ncbi:uncharacterized protein LOC115227721 [Octopus sinensis]|uniref:Uncharacterized protein LOC115227721 n=1 Tax=Octopus sinensis TaxID=2607531 RepID=A0A6P7TYJ5_9MOLL|nr:uncharacterized protein LOC115227721 [Octopus sinensis]
MFCCDVERTLDEFSTLISDGFVPQNAEGTLNIIQDQEFRRNRSKVNISLAIMLYGPTELRKNPDLAGLRAKLEKLNEEKTSQVRDHLEHAICNCVANARYNFVAKNGMKWTKISEETPIMRLLLFPTNNDSYFMNIQNSKMSLIEEEANIFSENSKFVIDIVSEKRLYDVGCGNTSNLYRCRRILNFLHNFLSIEGYDEV